MNLRKLYNPLMKWLLRSPLHGVISGLYLLITFTGRKSGRTYRTPVEYCREGDAVFFLTAPERVWWRNLKGGAPVTIRVRGRDLDGVATATHGDMDAFVTAMQVYFRKFPRRAGMFHIRLVDGEPDRDDCAAVADKYVVVRIQVA
jgi:deazaflavin-dependent oxidoreductase (nitroreductase family)